MSFEDTVNAWEHGCEPYRKPRNTEVVKSVWRRLPKRNADVKRKDLTAHWKTQGAIGRLNEVPMSEHI